MLDPRATPDCQHSMINTRNFPASIAFLLTLSGCSTTVSEDYVAAPRAELELLQQCLALVDEHHASDQAGQSELLQTLDAIRQNTAVQSGILQQQYETLERLQTSYCPAPRTESEPSRTADTGNRNAVEFAGKTIVGETEVVLLPEVGISLPARIDTGAATSSLDAENIETFERNGNRWVRFTIRDPITGAESVVERRRVRRVRIIQSTMDEGEVRPVVEMRLTIGNLTQVSEFTLTSRGHLEYPLLIGRNVLRDVMLVDVSRQNNVSQPAAPRAVDDAGDTIEYDEREDESSDAVDDSATEPSA